MKTTALIALTATLLLAGCMTQDARTTRVERRQDGVDQRTDARQERWKIRGEREDARVERRMDAW